MPEVSVYSSELFVQKIRRICLFLQKCRAVFRWLDFHKPAMRRLLADFFIAFFRKRHLHFL